MTKIYENMDFSVAPDNVTFSGSGASGLYKSTYDNNYHGFTVFSPSLARASRNEISFTVASSDEFNYVATFHYSSSIDSKVESIVQPDYGTYCKTTLYDYYARQPFSWTFIDTNGKYNGTSNSGTDYYNNEGIIYIAPSDGGSSYPRGGSNQYGSSYSYTIGFNPQNITIPSASVDTSTPWDYYNNTVLPELQREFPGMDDYFCFP